MPQPDFPALRADRLLTQGGLIPPIAS